jgi:uncharacterized protein
MMQYRPLGKTGLRVPAVGLGGIFGASTPEYAVRMVQRALELGVTYFDVARSYGDTEIKLGAGLKGQRSRAIISTKTGAKTREDAWREINESLERLQTDYVDNCHLHGLEAGADSEQRLGKGGALEALIQAKEQGLIRHIGCTSHESSKTLLAALARFDFEVILVPMNIVERDPLAELIPLCQAKGIGVTIMKPVATGLLPAPLAIKWLLNQPIACCVPGATTLEELEENALVGHSDTALSAAESARVQQIKNELEHVRCRICGDCLPCPQNIEIHYLLGTESSFDHHRTMGPQRFRAHPWSPTAITKGLANTPLKIASIESCTRCGECEKRCPHGLPIMDMLSDMLPALRDMVSAYRELAAQ